MSYKKSVFRSLAMVTQLGFSVITPIFLCIFAGYWIDSRFGIKIMIPLLILGFLAGASSAWQLVKSVQRAEEREDQQIKEALHSKKEMTDCQKPKVPSRIQSSKPDEKKEMDEDGMA